MSIAARCAETPLERSKNRVPPAGEGCFRLIRVGAGTEKAQLDLLWRRGEKSAVKRQIRQPRRGAHCLQLYFVKFARSDPIVRQDTLAEVVIQVGLNNCFLELGMGRTECLGFLCAARFVHRDIVLYRAKLFMVILWFTLACSVVYFGKVCARPLADVHLSVKGSRGAADVARERGTPIAVADPVSLWTDTILRCVLYRNFFLDRVHVANLKVLGHEALVIHAILVVVDVVSWVRINVGSRRLMRAQNKVPSLRVDHV